MNQWMNKMYKIELLTEDNRMLMKYENFVKFIEGQKLQTFDERGETAYTIFNGIIIERIE